MNAFIWLALACSELDGPQPMVSGSGFLDRPWPDDRRTIDGRPDLSDFPHRGDYELLDAFVDLAEQIEGFATNGTSYIQFDGPVNTARLPSPEESLQPDASLMLLNVDPSSPRRGEQIPIQWDYQDTDTDWLPANTLAVQPIWGAPLDPGTQYAVVISTDIASPPDDFASVWTPQHPEHAHYQSTQETLFQIRRSLEGVAMAFRFTTQSPTRDFAAVVNAIDTWLPRPEWTHRPLEYAGEEQGYVHYTGELSVPLWQEGEKPYAAEGGGFVFDDNGSPVLFGWDRCTFSVTVPKGEPPADGWPVVVYSHGTGGSHASFVGASPRPAGLMAREGVAMFGISQPLHADRGDDFNAELYSFNFLNPASGRTTFQQGGLDQVFLSRLLSESDLTFATDQTDENVRLDGTRMAYLGHSQGGQVGALAAPFWGTIYKGAVFSGTGGGLSITLMERDSGDFDIQGLISISLDVDPDELDTFHPILTLVQHDAEVTDPLNYARYWMMRQPPWTAAPLPVLQTEGLEDVYTPPWSTEALAGAAGLPVLDPSQQLSPIQLVTGLYDEPLPTDGNQLGWDGTATTAGLAQFPEQGHFAIFDESDAWDLYQAFLTSALMDSAPELIQP